MKVCIVGVGAIGGFIGGRLAAAGHCEVSAIEVGPALAALREHGWRLHQGGTLIQQPARVSDRAADFGPQDLVVVAVKGQVLPAVGPTVATLCGPQTVVLPAMNGVPWWFGHGTVLGDEPLQSVDPGGRVAAAIPFERVLGCVVHASSTAPEPGVVRHVMGQGLVIGEAGGGVSERGNRVGALLTQAGFDVTVTPNVRYDIWYKLWGNLTMNPVSAMTGATIDKLLADPLVRSFCSEAMREAAAIGARLGCEITQSAEDRHALTAKLGAFKTSMLQDAEAGRQLELDGIVAAVHEIGRRLGMPMPNIGALLGLARLFGRSHGLYPEEKPAGA
jgi:2-dehydropantoate 2-reductase